MHKNTFVCPKFCGSTTLGERGQVVIPAEARKKLKLQNGQKFVVAAHNGSLVLVPEKQMEKMLQHLTKILNNK